MDSIYKDSRTFQDEAKQDKKNKKADWTNCSYINIHNRLRVSASIADSKLHNKADWTMITTNDIRENV
jgi:hypothetical protein